MALHTYALDNTGNLVHISSVTKAQGSAEFHCLTCGNELIARMGNINEHHFSHKQIITCAGELYLHNLAKHKFYQKYRECLSSNQSFMIEYQASHFCDQFEKELGVVCRLDNQVEELNLIDHFKSIELEKKDDQFIPDILLKSPNGNKIYIEFAVTHLVEEEKIKSGNRIVEFILKSEEDFDLFMTGRIDLDLNKGRIRRFNFQVKDVYKNCKGNCKLLYPAFFVYESGKSIQIYISIQEYLRKRRRKSTVFAKLLSAGVLEVDENYYSFDMESSYVTNLIQTYESGVKVKNCFLCRYHARNSYMNHPIPGEDGPIFCKTYRKECPSNTAAECDRFKPDKSVYSAYLRP